MSESLTVGANGKRIVPSLVLMESVLFHPTRRERGSLVLSTRRADLGARVDGDLTPQFLVGLCCPLLYM
jgi:hypothetical protein